MFFVDDSVFRVLPSFTMMPELMDAKFLRISRVRFEMVMVLVIVFVLVIIKVSLSCIVIVHKTLQMFLLIVAAAALVLALHALASLLRGGVTAVVVHAVLH
jgi:hypothetical protein